MKNEIVHGFWIGEKLHLLQILSIKSFLHFGAEYHLWSYNQNLVVPQGVILRDAREIMPESSVFRYPVDGPIDLPHGRGSYAGFSDIFRYKLLYDHGGWWADLDITCLQPLRAEPEYFFRDHGVLPIVGNIMRCPPKSELMRRCYEESVVTVTEMNDDWHRPIKILCHWVNELGLAHFIQKHACNLDLVGTELPFLSEPRPLDVRWRFFHWMNTASRKQFSRGSTFEKLLSQFGVAQNSDLAPELAAWIN